MDEIHVGSIQKRLVGTKCPYCGKSGEGGTSVDDRQAKRVPKPGDIAVCLYCASINIYTDTLEMRRIERKERRAIERDPRAAELIEIAIGAAQNYRRGVQ